VLTLGPRGLSPAPFRFLLCQRTAWCVSAHVAPESLRMLTSLQSSLTSQNSFEHRFDLPSNASTSDSVSSTNSTTPLLPRKKKIPILSTITSSRPSSSSSSRASPSPTTATPPTFPAFHQQTPPTSPTDGTEHASWRIEVETSSTYPSKKFIPPHKINANSYCGRHSDQFLFTGWGDTFRASRDFVRSVIKKSDF